MHTFNSAWQKLFGDQSAADVLKAAGSTIGDIVDALDRASRGENVGSFLPTLPAPEPVLDDGEPVSDPYPPVESSPDVTGEFEADGTQTDEP